MTQRKMKSWEGEELGISIKCTVYCRFFGGGHRRRKISHLTLRLIFSLQIYGVFQTALLT